MYRKNSVCRVWFLWFQAFPGGLERPTTDKGGTAVSSLKSDSRGWDDVLPGIQGWPSRL